MTLLCLIALIAFTGCERANFQSALDPAGSQSRNIFGLYRLFFWVCTVVYVLVVAVMLIGAFRRRSDRSEAPIIHPPRQSERRLGATVITSLLVTTVILFVLLIGDFVSGRGLHAMSADADPLVIKVTAHQWWWDVTYTDAMPSQQMRTSNELHLPVGKTVKFELSSSDVIHSFWIPSLHGKKDMIPGRPTSTWIRAERPGTYYGQCAEFCGYQHAKMRLVVVVVESEDDFKKWMGHQLQPAPDPLTDQHKRGQRVFLESTCSMCHTIAGSGARATVGPDLTHVAGRPALAAGSLPNTVGHLAGWITDPQKVKPGARMPMNTLAPEDLQALLGYLQTLR